MQACAALEYRLHGRILAQYGLVGTLAQFGFDHGKRFAQPLQPRRSDRCRVELGNRVVGRRIPEAVEIGACLRHYRTGHQQVQVDEVDAVLGAEVFVAEVAATDQRDAVVRDPALVVHAMVEPAEAGAEFPGPAEPAAATRHRVVQPHLDACVGIERGEGGVLAAGIEVVHEDAHAHAAIGRLQRPQGDQPASEVVVPDVGLDIEAARGRLRAVCAQRVRLRSAGNQAEAGLIGMERLRRLDAIGDRAMRRRRQRGLVGQRRALRQPRARRQDQGSKYRRDKAHAMAPTVVRLPAWYARHDRCRRRE